MRMRTSVFAAVAFLAASGASAATVNIDFDSGTLSGGTYVEDGFTFTSSSSGGVGTANSCGSACLQLNNNEIVTMTFSGGAFDLLGFSFNSPGNGGDILANGFVEVETQNGNTLTQVSYPTLNPTPYLGVLSFTFQNNGNGAAFVDDIIANIPVSEVPLPATGMLMLGGLGAIALRRRRKAS